MRFSSSNLGAMLLVTAIALSGCAGSAPKASDQPPASPIVDDESGAIQGIVTTSELEPIKNAQVALQSGALDPTLSDADGRFLFSGLEPGKHVVFITALGYESLARNVEVIASEISELSIQLQELQSDAPFSVSELKDGYIACGTGTGKDGVAGFTQVECGSNDPNQEFLFKYNFAKDLKGILFEMTWKPSQALSKDLALMIEKEGCGFTCGDKDIFAQVQGCCYIRIALPVENMTKPDGELPASDFTEKGGTIQSRTFPAFGEDDNPTTVFTAQEFAIQVEYFYHELPADWETRSNVVQS
jgi:hypothetical protein